MIPSRYSPTLAALWALAATAVSVVVATPASAASTALCGQAIVANVTLTEDVGPCQRNGILIGADNITLDLGGHRLFGLPGPGDGHTSGVNTNRHTGITVQNGTISDFDAGVYINHGSNNVITGLTLSDNVGPDNAFTAEFGDGVYVLESPSNRITNNTIRRNGIYDGIGVYGRLASGNVIEDNRIEDTVGPSDRGPAGQGIIVNGYSGEDPLTGEPQQPAGQTVEGNVISGNIIRRSASAGIANSNHVSGLIVGNVVEDNGRTNAAGNGIGIGLGPGANVPGTRLLVRDNQVHGNGRNGIELLNTATGNQILNNDASGNNALRAPGPPPPPLIPDPSDLQRGLDALLVDVNAGYFYDLRDHNPLCAGNVWVGNLWGTGGFSPACTTVGGSQVAPRPRPPAADFDGDRATDLSVFRPQNGVWYLKGSAQTSTAFGATGDIPVPADYDGDGRTDVAVFRPSTGVWFVRTSAGDSAIAFGASGDLPVPADYDGDARADLAVFRPSTGVWYLHQSTNGDTAVAFGAPGDIPVPGYYDQDAKADLGVFRPAQGVWFLRLSTGGEPSTAFGATGDVPVPADYDGDGVTDLGVFRPAQGVWFLKASTVGESAYGFGASGDVPVPGDYDGSGTDDIAVFRPSTGTWFVRNGSATAWGAVGDRPLPLAAAVATAMFP